MRLFLGLSVLIWTGALLVAGPLDVGPQDPPVELPADPPPMRRQRGAWTLSMRSQVIFTSAPDRPHTLAVDLAYPQRGRWMLRAKDPGEDRRTLVYRYGSRLWSIPFGTATSYAAKDNKAQDMRLMFALRRALLAWPHQFKWTGEGKQREASLGKLGSLLAHLNEQDYPILLEARHADGSAYETLTDLQWKAVDGKLRPASFYMIVNGEKIWHEKILRVDRSLRFLDSYFMPHDQRPEAPPRAAQKSRRFAYPAGLEWEHMVKNGVLDPRVSGIWREQARRELGKEGGELLAGLGRVIDEGGRLVSVLLIAQPGQAAASGSWKVTPPRSGLIRRLPQAGPPDATHLRALVAEAREGGTPSRIVLWEAPDGTREIRVEVVP
jgi:hypothetical protein